METKQEKKLVPIQAKSFGHIRCDEDGNTLSVNGKNQFFFNGKLVYEGPYLHFDLHNGNYAISKRENKNEIAIYINGQKSYTLQKKDLVFKENMFYQFQMEEVPLYWRVLNGKLITIERECLYYDGKLLLEKDQFDDYRVIGDRLFVEKEEVKKGAYEVSLSDGNLVKVEAPKLRLIKEDGEGKFLFAFPNQFFRDGKMVFHLGRYLRDLGKKGSLYRFDWNKGVFAFEVKTEVQGKFRDIINRTVYIDGKVIEEKSNQFIYWSLVNGKLLVLKDYFFDNGNIIFSIKPSIHYDGKVLFKHEELDEYDVINHHLFIKKEKKYYQVLLPEEL
ncbi:MAG: hypothetical protein DLD55_03690 [candidate division SR1 bacterium]|nr:MAG: hypothetical protein DLD55_03690 [candidate division SR1 bacterium]